ncbi:hypothetical protein ANO11243_053080 [Dothideomycetidae sp. 11243]|nr:hypothetical protein ANO11243_053080 [fungal sp. No.11243]
MDTVSAPTRACGGTSNPKGFPPSPAIIDSEQEGLDPDELDLELDHMPSEKLQHPDRTPLIAGTTPPVRRPLVRSCLNCHQRRIKCDKGRPCAGCIRTEAECTYPTGPATRRRRRRADNSELLGRIKELEVDVDRLRGAVAVSQEQSAHSRGTRDTSFASSRVSSPSSDVDTASLVVNMDSSQYLNDAFWFSGLKEAMETPEGQGIDDLSDDDTVHQCFVFGRPLLPNAMLRELRPDPSQTFAIWESYKTNVDSFAKVLHIPTARNLMMTAVSNRDSLSRPAEALYFTICFGAVISMTEEQCEALLNDEREHLIKRFRRGTEQALARASFMNSSSLTCLQAFALYISFVRCLDESKTVWALGRLAGNLAVSLGLHRDGTHFGLKPFDTEMRRRLWWYIWSLNQRSSEDHGMDPFLDIAQFHDTHLPLNINDEDLVPDTTSLPEEREGYTEMLQSKLRYELGIWFTEIVKNKQRYKSQEDRDAIIEKYRSMIDEKYMRHCDLRNSAQFLVHSFCRLLITKLWLFFALPGSLSAATNNADTPAPERERVFETAVEAIEIWVSIIGHKDAARWNWSASAFMQWQLVCYIFAELPKRRDDTWTQRAWDAISFAWGLPHIRPQKTASSVLWKGLDMLWRRALPLRRMQNAQREERARQEQQRLLQLEKGQQVRMDHLQQLQNQQLHQNGQHSALMMADSVDIARSPQMVTGLNPPSPLHYHQGQPSAQTLNGAVYRRTSISAQGDYTFDPNSGPSPGFDPSAPPLNFDMSQDWSEIGQLDPVSFSWNYGIPMLGVWDDINDSSAGGVGWTDHGDANALASSMANLPTGGIVEGRPDGRMQQSRSHSGSNGNS